MIKMEQTVNKIVSWLQEQVEQANVRGLLVGVSGGLDSAVIVNLIKRAFPNNSLGVIMPVQNNPEDIIDAENVVNACGVDYLNIDLSDSHGLLYGAIKQGIKAKNEWNDEQDRIADANLRARLRMSALYTIATNYEYLVVGTDNAAEWHTGYFTKYGDGGVDIQPIADLTKGEVSQLASYLKVPLSVIEKQPSADLWEGQTDELEMGTTYNYIDAYLKGESIPEPDRK